MEIDAESHETPLLVMSLKGKAPNRGWASLPPDVIRLVLSHLIREYNQQPAPTGWAEPKFWPNRILFTALHTSFCIEPYLMVCRSWRTAMCNHIFFAHICTVLDPTNQLQIMKRNQLIESAQGKSSAPIPEVRLNHEHYIWIRTWTCMACRMRRPISQENFVQIRRQMLTMFCGRVPLCRDHKLDMVCGRCLRSEAHFEESFEPVIARSEDEEAFPFLDATCASCREEAIDERAKSDLILKEARARLQTDRPSVDWEIRKAIEDYIEYGEGTVSRIVAIGWEKTWLRENTKIAEYLEQAIAGIRYQNREDGYESEDEASDDDDVLCNQEEAGVRDISMIDHCRLRIMEGHWTIPFDSWLAFTNRQRVPVIPSQIPVGYLRSAEAPGAIHPCPEVTENPPPPTHELASRISHIHQQELRNILAPALNNLVRMLVFESRVLGTDASIKASRMTPEDVIQGLHIEGVWFNNFDWFAQWDEEEKQRERHREREKERVKLMEKEAAARATVRPQRVKVLEDETEDSTSDRTSPSVTTGSAGSHETSPVLSASTLQTTPSPPPLHIFACRRRSSDGEIKEIPERVRLIPCVPLSSEPMSMHTKDAIRFLWREACSPLFHCRCSICVRSMIAEKNNQAAMALGMEQQQQMQQEIQIDPALTHGDLNVDEKLDQARMIEIELAKADAMANADLEAEDDDHDDELLRLAGIHPSSGKGKRSEMMDLEEEDDEFDSEEAGSATEISVHSEDPDLDGDGEGEDQWYYKDAMQSYFNEGEQEVEPQSQTQSKGVITPVPGVIATGLTTPVKTPSKKRSSEELESDAPHVGEDVSSPKRIKLGDHVLS